jgi:alkylation response protein AidB-like acyl-CoA dehydrogenase
MTPSLLKKIQHFVSNQVHTWILHNAENIYPELLIDEMKNLGIFGMNIPQEFGGLGLSLSDIATVVATIAEGSVSLTSISGSHLTVCSYVRDFGTLEQRKILLPDLASGKIIAAFAHTEEMGKSLDSMQTKIIKNRKNKNHWSISGSKSFVTNALHADLFAIVAKIVYQKEKEYPAIVLLKRDSVGLTIGPDIPRLGLKSISVCKLVLGKCPVDITEDVIGSISCDAKKMMESTQVDGLINYAARAIGLVRTIMRETMEYTKVKKSGNYFLADIPYIQARLSEMMVLASSLETMFNDMMSNSKDMKYVSVEKTKITEGTVSLALMAIGIYGGNGYTSQYPIEQHLRDAIGLTIIGGRYISNSPDTHPSPYSKD